MTYKKRLIKIEFTLTDQVFDGIQGPTNDNVLTIDNARAIVEYNGYGGAALTTLTCRVYGLNLSNMAKLSYAGNLRGQTKNNRIKVWAQDELIFSGTITFATTDFNEAPDAPLVIEAHALGAERSLPSSPFSVEGSVDVIDAIRSIADPLGIMVSVLEDIKFSLSNPHVVGDPVSQIIQLANIAKLNIDCSTGTIRIWSLKGSWNDIVPYVSKDNGLVGYPTWTRDGLYLTTMFSSNLIAPRKMQLKTELPGASGMYTINTVKHVISSWVDGGPWFSFVVANQDSES
ncbi:hypothetical protein EYZ00_03790 [Hafnia paralvei]|uniref:hypothetical protein n=1 Tax=Hafnia paralvei TaxID=546367 RepID=UPI001033F617|nr:hypothetical protein [Hafnia paralvei]TBL55588.1 hypothetical protein EYZ00_03790 [Hafnia paralvei]